MSELILPICTFTGKQRIYITALNQPLEVPEGLLNLDEKGQAPDSSVFR